MPLDFGKERRPACPRPGDDGHAYGEKPARTLAHGAPEPAHLDAQGDDARLPRQVGQDAHCRR